MEGLPDLAALLAAIEGDLPSGVDLRLDESPTAAIRNLRDARKTATQTERRRDSSEDPSSEESADAQWALIANQAPDLIASRSKDLELAAWLTEALLRAHKEAPLAGLAFGFRLMAGLIENFWPETFPPPEDGDEYEKVRAIAQLSGESAEGTLFAPLRRLMVTRSGAGESYALWQYENAFALAQRPAEQRERRIAEGALTVETIEESANASPGWFYVQLRDQLTECLAALADLDRIATEKCGSYAPSVGRIREFLDEFLSTVKRLGRRVMPAETVEGGAAGEGAVDLGLVEGGGGGPAAGGGGGSFSLSSGNAAENREAALRALQQIADFFRRTEPHSLLSYTLEDAVRRARMSLPELMAELIGDDAVRQQFFANAGYKLPPAADSSGY
ncbi:type VI secretion system protein TssA [Zavarzinia compransoris]|uniref:Type VI secretion system protein TssA n=1 Tax=Zavarzinia compransoris TaxID=1264899 RepID=A0A317E758_9PROT|nr:type VI secretion system protein TssA [Zavarzinia compransoris]PWR22332.1 type VI secretion system protein TssA [Zavarzinia compransoris]TDP46902.1 type VI secretion system protein ImpA [Zavarzinia compransoris]